MRVYYVDQNSLPLPPGHRFPAAKYFLLRERVFAAGLFLPEELEAAPAASAEVLGRAHDGEYVRRVLQGELSEKEMRRIGFPWSRELVERSQRSVGATIAASRAALDHGLAVALGGGTHHAYADHGEGYCVFNDVAVAARQMQAEGRVQRVVVIDCDVHQGNGTAAIFAGDASVYTFSIHCQKNFPFHKEPSRLDIGLPNGTGDEPYLEALAGGLRQALEESQPDLAFYLAGADPFVDDSLGRLTLTKAGLARRDQMVFGLCQQAGLPVAVTMAGGYARNINDTVDIHFQTVKIARQFRH